MAIGGGSFEEEFLGGGSFGSFTFKRPKHGVAGGSWNADRFLPKEILARRAQLARLKALREIPGEEREAEIRWGQSPNFEYVTKRREQPKVTIHFPSDDAPVDDDDEQIPFTEISKEVEEIRVENPDDPEQYVMVERRISSVFENGEDGRRYRFTYLNDTE